MKRLFVFIVVSLFFTFNSLFVFAASGTYDIDELDLRLTIPTGYSVITRDTPASDSIYDSLGTTQSDIIEHFEESNIYLDAISDSYNEEIVVTMTESDLSNFSLLSDTLLDSLASTLSEYYITYGFSVSKYEIYNHSQAKFVKLYFTDIAGSVHGLQYYTIYDGKAINFTMRSYQGSISSRQENTIKAVVNSIKFKNSPPVAQESKNTPSFVHNDYDSGVTFTVPANWEQQDLTKDREYIDVKFASTKEAGCTIIYGSTDMWSEMSSYEKIGNTRSGIDNSALSRSDIAEMYDITADEISTVTYNGVEYYKCEVTQATDVYGLEISLTMTQLIYLNNGWMYTFQFSGTSSHKMYADFEKLLNTVSFPEVYYETSSEVTAIASDTQEDDSDSNGGVIAVISLLLIPAIIMIPIFIFRSKKDDRVENENAMEKRAAYESQSHNAPEQFVFCTNCGQKLPNNSTFCHICGNKIKEEQ